MLFALVALLSSIEARPRRRECSEDRSSDVSSCTSSNENSDYIKCYTKICGEKKGRENCLEVAPFICLNGGCPMPARRCTPFSEFDFATEFFAKIPHAARLEELFNKRDVQGLVRMASRCKGAEHYDALNAFYYNADAHVGVCDLSFDSNFIQYFLVRFYFFLDRVFIENSAIVSGDKLINLKDNKPIDLLCPPCPFSDLTFGSQAEALAIFNTIITDTVITPVLKDFIAILVHQLRIAKCACEKQNAGIGCLNTYTVYVNLLGRYLLRTAQIVQENYDIKYRFVNGEKQFMFVYLPYTITDYSPEKTKVVSIINIPVQTYTTPGLIAKYLK